MLDRLLGALQLAHCAADQFFHLLASAENGDGLLVLVSVYFDLVDEFLVDELVLADEH